VTQSFLDTRTQPLRARSWRSSWPRNIRQFEVVEVAAVPVATDPPGEGGAGHGVDLRSRMVYGGGELIGPLTPQDVSDLIAAGFGSLLTTFPDDYVGKIAPNPQYSAQHGADSTITTAWPYGINASSATLSPGSTDRAGGVTFTTVANLPLGATVCSVQFAVPLDVAPLTVVITPGVTPDDAAAGIQLAAKSPTSIYVSLATPNAAVKTLDFTYTTSLP
jgi:hypothetical protein